MRVCVSCGVGIVEVEEMKKYASENHEFARKSEGSWGTERKRDKTEKIKSKH